MIHDYRERLVEAGPADLEQYRPGVSRLFDKLRPLYPSQDIQMHLLHLATTGEIHPHVDNLEASGSWILGVSLGSPRFLRLESEGCEPFEVLLPSGSVYVQRCVCTHALACSCSLSSTHRDDVRFNYKHSILKPETTDNSASNHQRLSIMIRVSPFARLPPPVFISVIGSPCLSRIARRSLVRTDALPLARPGLLVDCRYFYG